MEAPAVAAGTELKRRRRQKKKKKKPMTNDEDMPIDFDQGDNRQVDRGRWGVILSCSYNGHVLLLVASRLSSPLIVVIIWQPSMD